MPTGRGTAGERLKSTQSRHMPPLPSPRGIKIWDMCEQLHTFGFPYPLKFTGRRPALVVGQYLNRRMAAHASVILTFNTKGQAAMARSQPVRRNVGRLSKSSIVPLFWLVMTISLFNMSESFAAGFAKCDLFVKVSDAAYAMVQGHPSCGLDPNDPRWKFPPSQDYEYRSFCAGALDDTIDQLTQQINDATNRCRVCSARLEQCEAQDYYAYIYHCVLKSENHVCDCYEGRHPPNYDDGLRDSAVSTYMVSRCVSVPFYFIDSPLKEKRCSEAVINTVDEPAKARRAARVFSVRC